jgi:hypothetical protein
MNGLRGVDDDEFLLVLENTDVLARSDGDHRKNGPLWLPASRAAANMVVGDLPADFDSYLIMITLTDQNSAREIFGSPFYAVVH